MISIKNSAEQFNSFMSELKGKMKDWVKQEVEARLESEVEQWLHRQPYKRRKWVRGQKTQAQCNRCGARYAGRFSRNGHRSRQLVTCFGVLDVWLPRVVCECGGSVNIPFSIVEPYQRLWTDLLAQIGRWAGLGLSLRQMQTEIGEQMQSQVGLRTLNTVRQQVRQPVELSLSSVPPVVLLDAIWVTCLNPSPTQRLDRLGRQRVPKHRNKVCLLVALGLYPQTGRWGILAWHLADSESQTAWEQLLAPLEVRGLYRERGVELFIHDGGSGLIAALQMMYPHIPHQRCLFHKFRNLWHAIRPPANLPRQALLTFKRTLFQQVRTVFYASSPLQATQRRDAFCTQWQTDQPELVASLSRDWHESIAFFRILTRFPTWQLRYLRTTSLLERINRKIRRLFRAASAFHSAAGLLATAARVLDPLRLT